MDSYKICVELYEYSPTIVSIGAETELEKAKEAARTFADFCGDLTFCDVLRVYVERGIDENVYEIRLAERA